MGNTHSSSGIIVGSVLGGLLVAPFTDWSSLVAIAIASCIGIIVGITTYIYNNLYKNIPQKIEKKRNLIVGTAYGVIILMCGYTCTLDDKIFLYCLECEYKKNIGTSTYENIVRAVQSVNKNDKL